MTKYLEDGQAVEILQKIEGGFLVSNIFSAHSSNEGDEDGDEDLFFESKSYFVKNVFDSAPTAVLDKEIARRNAQLTEMSERASVLREDIFTSEKQIRDRMNRIKQHNKLNVLDDFLAGKITHYAVLNGYTSPTIILASEAVSDESRWDKKLKMLTLYGDSKGDISWRMHKYSDGSGSSDEVVPALSYDDAREHIRSFVAAKMASADRSHLAVLDGIVAWAYEWSVDVTADISTSIAAHREGKRIKEISGLQQQIKDAKAKIEKLIEVTA